MSNPIRRLAAPLAIAGLLLSLSHPAVASQAFEVETQSSSVPMMFDVLIMRPIGLAATVIGTAVYVFPVLPLMAMTRPADIGKPIRPLIGEPARFTFSDPIGTHP